MKLKLIWINTVMSIRSKYIEVIARNEIKKQSEINHVRLFHPCKSGFAMTNIKKVFGDNK